MKSTDKKKRKKQPRKSEQSLKKIAKKILIILIILLLNFLWFKYVQPVLMDETSPSITEESLPQTSEESTFHVEETSFTTLEETMSVHFIDVGQADATLFIQGDKVMLFDVGEISKKDEKGKVLEYIQKLGIDYIDVLILSHPHDDHMGGAVEILNNIEVGIVYGPNCLDDERLDLIEWWGELMDTIDSLEYEKNYGKSEDEYFELWHTPKDENGEFVEFNFGDAKVEFLAPFDDFYEDENNYSICAKISFGEVDLLFTGDAETSVEKDLINAGYDLDIEIFQAAHHGSKTGNSKKFIEAMTPECIVISCGMKNRYNHPTEEVIKRFETMKIPVYRTDESGDIVLTTDGKSYSFNVKPGTYTSGKAYRGE